MLVAEVLPHGSILFNACQYNIYVCHCTIIMIIIVVVAMIIITIINKDIIIVMGIAAADITITVASSIVIVVTTGQTVEMHGNINQLVCPSCGVVVMMTPALLRKLKSKKPVPCTKCNCGAIRCRIMLYDDAEGTCCCTLLLSFFLLLILFFFFFSFFFFFFHPIHCHRTSIIGQPQSWQHDMRFWCLYA